MLAYDYSPFLLLGVVISWYTLTIERLSCDYTLIVLCDYILIIPSLCVLG